MPKTIRTVKRQAIRGLLCRILFAACGERAAGARDREKSFVISVSPGKTRARAPVPGDALEGEGDLVTFARLGLLEDQVHTVPGRYLGLGVGVAGNVADVLAAVGEEHDLLVVLHPLRAQQLV